MQYNNTSGYQFNNQTPWKTDLYEIALVLAEDGRRRPANRLPIKCCIPTLMGKKSAPIPKIFRNAINDSVYINDSGCRIPVSSSIETQNYISVDKGDNEYYNHYWLNHAQEIWVQIINNNILEIYADTSYDPSYCDSCISQHPTCNVTHHCSE